MRIIAGGQRWNSCSLDKPEGFPANLCLLAPLKTASIKENLFYFGQTAHKHEVNNVCLAPFNTTALNAAVCFAAVFLSNDVLCENFTFIKISTSKFLVESVT